MSIITGHGGCTPSNPALGKQRQANCKFEASLVYMCIKAMLISGVFHTCSLLYALTGPLSAPELADSDIWLVTWLLCFPSTSARGTDTCSWCLHGCWECQSSSWLSSGPPPQHTAKLRYQCNGGQNLELTTRQKGITESMAFPSNNMAGPSRGGVSMGMFATQIITKSNQWLINTGPVTSAYPCPRDTA